MMTTSIRSLSLFLMLGLLGMIGCNDAPTTTHDGALVEKGNNGKGGGNGGGETVTINPELCYVSMVWEKRRGINYKLETITVSDRDASNEFNLVSTELGTSEIFRCPAWSTDGTA